MFIPRSKPRLRLARPATISVAPAFGEPWVVPARTVDLNARGAGLLAAEPLPAGLDVIVTVEDHARGLRRVRRWVGRVVQARDDPSGTRIGVAFDQQEGPDERFHLPRAGGGAPAADRVLRRDPPWGEPRPIPDFAEAGPPHLNSWQARVAMGVATLGLLADQVIKGKVAASPLAAHALIVRNFGALGGLSLGTRANHQILALLSLFLAGMGLRLALAGRQRPRPLEAVGWGLLLAGLLGNAVDRLALGYVRDMLRSDLLPRWVFNPADALAVAGALCLALAWLVPRRDARRPAPSTPSPVETLAVTRE